MGRCRMQDRRVTPNQARERGRHRRAGRRGECARHVRRPRIPHWLWRLPGQDPAGAAPSPVADTDALALAAPPPPRVGSPSLAPFRRTWMGCAGAVRVICKTCLHVNGKDTRYTIHVLVLPPDQQRHVCAAVPERSLSGVKAGAALLQYAARNFGGGVRPRALGGGRMGWLKRQPPPPGETCAPRTCKLVRLAQLAEPLGARLGGLGVPLRHRAVRCRCVWEGLVQHLGPDGRKERGVIATSVQV